jgi:3-phenylpropionate/cinnamic acid dioxygenase small subunit
MQKLDDRLDDLVDREAIRELIGQTAARLDAEDLAGWIALFAPEAEYELSAYSREIRADMSWWKTARPDLDRMLEDIPQHVRDSARRLHIVSPLSIRVEGNRAGARSHFAVLRTLDDGETHLYVAGRYEDSLVKAGGRWLYAKHHAILDTRMLETFTHLPL